jgi:catechol 2,3-dioxygenase
MAAPPLSFSHVGLFVRDLDEMAAFYRDFMGFLVTDRGHLPQAELVFLSRDPREHHQLVLVSGRPESACARVVNQISFRAGSLLALCQLYHGLAGARVTDIDPVTHGTSWSLYFRDPEGNRIEVFADTDWYIPQPCRIRLDLSWPPERIYAETEAFCRAQPGCRPLADWQAEFDARLAAELAAMPRNGAAS